MKEKADKPRDSAGREGWALVLNGRTWDPEAPVVPVPRGGVAMRLTMVVTAFLLVLVLEQGFAPGMELASRLLVGLLVAFALGTCAFPWVELYLDFDRVRRELRWRVSVLGIDLYSWRRYRFAEIERVAVSRWLPAGPDAYRLEMVTSDGTVLPFPASAGRDPSDLYEAAVVIGGIVGAPLSNKALEAPEES